MLNNVQKIFNKIKNVKEAIDNRIEYLQNQIKYSNNCLEDLNFSDYVENELLRKLIEAYEEEIYFLGSLIINNKIVILDEHNKNIINKNEIEKVGKRYLFPAIKCNKCDGRYFYKDFFECTGMGELVICDKCGDRDYAL